MPTLEFIAYVSNVDDSILGLETEHDLRPMAIPWDEYWHKFHQTVERGSDLLYPAERVIMDFQAKNFKTGNVYVLATETQIDEEQVKHDKYGPTLPISQDSAGLFLHNHVYNVYLRALEDKLRLFAAGSVAIPAYRMFLVYKGSRYSMGGARSLYPVVGHDVFTVSDPEELNRFLETFELIPEHQYLELAHSAFRESYSVSSPRLQFLSLMIALEAIFNRGHSEISYKLRRGVAALVGESVEHSLNLEARVKALYGLRSKLLHEGSHSGVTREAVNDLRQIARRVLVTVSHLDCTKPILLDVLNQIGFGQSDRISALIGEGDSLP